VTAKPRVTTFDFLLRSNVNAALAVVTSLLVERIVHTRIVEVLTGIVCLNSLENTESAESCGNNNRNDDTGNSTGSETNSKNLILAKNRLLERACSVDANTNFALAPSSTVLDVSNAAPEGITRVVSAGLVIVARGPRGVDTASSSCANLRVAGIVSARIEVIAELRGVDGRLNASISRSCFGITLSREALVSRIARNQSMLAESSGGSVNFVKSASIAIIAISRVAPVN